MIEDSKTLPQFVQTASALDGSTSISVDPQELHFRLLDMMSKGRVFNLSCYTYDFDRSTEKTKKLK